jgi:hypothetical protein
MANAVHAMDTSDSMLGNALDTISPTLGNDPPGMSFISNGTADMSSAKTPGDAFTVVLSGTYQPVTKGPNVGPDINLSDGSGWTKIDFYPVSGIGNNQNHPIGNFFVQANAGVDSFVGYNVPGRGTMEMQFTNIDLNLVYTSPAGDQFFQGTEDLNIVAATGAFAGFVGGHNHMVDDLTVHANGQQSDTCFCNITPPT